MAEVKSEKLGTMPEGKLLFQMSLPIIISMMVQAIYNIVDSIFVARLSEKALTAVTISFPIQNIIIAFSVGLSIGVSALLSRYLGMKNEKKASSVAVHGIILAGFLSLIFVVVAIFFVEPFIKMQTDDPTIISYGIDYLKIVCSLSLGVFFQIFFEKLLQSTGLTVYTMVTQIIGAVINIILDPIFIFGLFGFPRLEVKGAHGVTVLADKAFDEINIEDYRAMYIPGGQPGATNLMNDKKVLECANVFNDEERKVIAICAGPQVLDAAGLLKDGKFTCYPGVEKRLKVKDPQDEAVVVEENIITAMGPALAILLGVKLVEVLVSKEKAEEVAEGLLLPQLKKFI